MGDWMYRQVKNNHAITMRSGQCVGVNSRLVECLTKEVVAFTLADFGAQKRLGNLINRQVEGIDLRATMCISMTVCVKT